MHCPMIIVFLAELTSAIVSAFHSDDLDSGLKVSVSFGGTLFHWFDDDLNGGYLSSDTSSCVLNIVASDVRAHFLP